MPTSPEAERRIRAYHGDRGWREDVRAYTGVEPPAQDTGTGALAPRAVGEAHHLAHLEQMAREDYKLRLHAEWLAALADAVEPGRPFQVLDYGCGAASFASLALAWPEVRCTLAEASEVLLGYLRWRVARRGDARLEVVTLPARRGCSGATARLRIDVAAVEGRFDAIVLADVLEHTLDPLRVLVHLLARLRPGGIAFVNYPSEIDGDWHTPEAFFQRAACFWLLRLCCRHANGHAWRRRAGPLPALALALARAGEPLLRRASRRFARRVFAERGASIVARVRELAGRELRVEELLSDV